MTSHKYIFISFIAVVFMLIQDSAIGKSIDPKAVVSFEGSYFYPRRAKFREFYGEGLPALGAQLDMRLSDKNWICFKIRYVKMSERSNLNFTDISMGILLRRDFRPNQVTPIYCAGGASLDYRKIEYKYSLGVPNSNTVDQKEWSPSLAVVSGFDWWITHKLKLGPQVDFTYFPFGDPSTGDFGDTGGFYFVLGVGIKL